MDESPIPIAEHDLRKAWAEFPKSPIQTVLHNEFLKLMAQERKALTKVKKVEDLEVAKGRMEVVEKVIGVLHRHDPLPTRYKRER